MKNKFSFLTRESIKKKINTKAFKIINLILCIIIIGVINLDSIVKFFGGDFNELVKIYVVDEVGVYSDFKNIMSNSYLDVLENYNAEVVETDKTLDELKENITKEETKDIIVYFKEIEDVSFEKVFDVEFISYEYIDGVLYQNLLNAVNTTKANAALKLASIDQSTLDEVYKGVEVNRVILSEDVKEDEEFMELIGSIVTIVFIIPFFLLIVLIVQGALLLLYALIGSIIRVFTSGGLMSSVNNVVASNPESVGKINEYINLFLQSDIASKLVMGIPLFIVLILLSFLAYSLLTGILASITTSMEDYNQIQTPVMVFLMLGYFLAIYASLFRGSTFINVMAYVPFISGILAPVMYTLGEITIVGLIVSILLLAVVCVLLYKYGLKVYKVGILNYSSSNLWKKIYKALKAK